MSIQTLSDDLLQVIFEFVGPGQFRYVVGVNRQFQNAHAKLCENNNATTTMKSVVESIPRCLIHLEENRKLRFKILTTIGRFAARHGNVQVLEFAIQPEWVLQHEFGHVQ
jgi:hypothetical protein